MFVSEQPTIDDSSNNCISIPHTIHEIPLSAVKISYTLFNIGIYRFLSVRLSDGTSTSRADNQIRTGTPNLEGWYATITSYLHGGLKVTQLHISLHIWHKNRSAIYSDPTTFCFKRQRLTVDGDPDRT